MRITGKRRGGGRLSIEWPTLILIVACYGLWLAAGILLWPQWPLAALALLTIAIALQSSLMHECLHGHPTRDARLNESLVFLPIGLVYPYRRFKALHLRHHADERLTDPFEDPESYYKALWRYEELPRWARAILAVNNTMAGRFVLGPVIMNIGFLAAEAKLIGEGDRAVRRAWGFHVAGLAVVLPLVAYGFSMPLWLYVLVPAWLGQSLISVRTFAEHQWSERPDGRTIIVERSPLALLFLNNNLHLVHHKMPSAPWYRLPSLYRAKRAEWLRMNGGYAYPGYLALLKDFAFRPKEPVPHPVLRRAREKPRAFSPRARGRSLGSAGGVAVPARPAKE
ncbi:fatty acid desaturase [Nitratireductor pacificus]|uniref:Fatty acid desaturase n=1 Tax=Nitratireductor pacificus pht-3B TaxID=391937 RepID=K2MC22_9HYPH|nr:fatty acid desaturase [Nitratireductor pacificus]EKF19666.1 fatty acid desaturase [Nitratireductor pacificus pht-3B]